MFIHIKDLKIELKEPIKMFSPNHLMEALKEYTSLAANHLRCVMHHQMEEHRKEMQCKYEKMVRDMSNCLAQERSKLAKYYEERHGQLTRHFQQLCQHLQQVQPTFKFEEYYNNPDQYVKRSIARSRPKEEQTTGDDSATSSLEWAEQTVTAIQERLGKVREDNSKLEKQLSRLRAEQKQILCQALRSEANAQQENSELRERQDDLRHRYENTMFAVKQKDTHTQKTRSTRCPAKLLNLRPPTY